MARDRLTPLVLVLMMRPTACGDGSSRLGFRIHVDMQITKAATDGRAQVRVTPQRPSD
jgi:hypothetical protein